MFNKNQNFHVFAGYFPDQNLHMYTPHVYPIFYNTLSADFIIFLFSSFEMRYFEAYSS